ncbi:cyclic AMP-responsive element-binding protein 3-like protein 3, partial [Striga asiatica]
DPLNKLKCMDVHLCQVLLQPKAVYRQRNLEKMKRKYADFDSAKKKDYIDKVRSRNKLRNPQDKWFLRAQITMNESEGSIDTSLNSSPQTHEWKKVQKCSYCDAARFQYEPLTFFVVTREKLKLHPLMSQTNFMN